MLLRKCLILLALFSFSAAPMMGCTPPADTGSVPADGDTDGETENGNDTNS